MQAANKQSQHISKRILLRLTQWLGTQSSPEWATVMGTALLVGAGAGLGAVIFRILIEKAQWLFFDVGAQIFGFLGDYYIIVIPALGGLIVGPLVYFFAREAKGHGVPEVMEAVALKGGRIRPRVAAVKSLASSICIGSGGSVGREGPIVQIGSALGSTLGQMLHLSESRIRILVACGAAGGISATFNAPIAGTIFALEVILGELQATYFGAVVISAVIADVVAHIFEGATRAFPIPAYAMDDPSELFLYALLGVLAALVSIAYTKSVYRMEDLFDAWKRFPEYLKPVIGGLGMGIIGVLLVAAGLTFEQNGNLIPAVFGVGYETVTPALLGQLSIEAAIVLLLVKLLATSLTLGSGGSGGVFAPGLFLGAMLGVAFGHIVNAVFPGTDPSGAFALVAMAAVFAGTAHAPATAILILFEMTGDYNIILPLMFATVISVIVSRIIEPESIYTLKLSRRGVRLQHGRDVDLLEGVTVREAMSEEFDVVSAEMSILDLMAEFERTHHHGYPVVDKEGLLIGVVSVGDLDLALDKGLDNLTVADITSTTGLLVAYPHESLGTAMLRMDMRGIGRLPVVSSENPRKLLGILRRHHLVRAYSRAIARRAHIAHRLKALEQHGSENVNIIEIDINVGMGCTEKSLHDLAKNLPQDCIVVSIQRDKRTLIPHGNTVLQAGDHLILLVGKEDTEEARAAFC